LPQIHELLLVCVSVRVTELALTVEVYERNDTKDKAVSKSEARPKI